jgi:DNA invertase Pin-like site-specific DNA recombinase
MTKTPKPNIGSGTLIRAAQYIRMSADHQKYSTENQSAANRIYGASHGIEIVRTYADKGKSGLHLKRRNALKQLFQDVLSGTADFTAILVYDISRWGRFQDVDESAHWEFLCRKAGMAVHYCAEQFENDGSPISAVVKGLKRAMAAEYSRELSVKVRAGHARLFKLGYRQGGAVPYGMRRLLVDEHGIPKGVLARHEYKSIQSDRTILILGPLEERRLVQWIFSSFVRKRNSVRKIVRLLNAKATSDSTQPNWTPAIVDRILQNEIYVGNIVWNRTSITLGTKLVHNPEEIWFRIDGAIKPTIGQTLFDQAQNLIRVRGHPASDERVLAQLSRLFEKHGFLSGDLIDTSAIPSVSTYIRRFGSLSAAYKLVGCDVPTSALTDDELLIRLKRLLKRKGCLSETIIDRAKGVPSASTYRNRFGRLRNAYASIGYAPDPQSQQAMLETTRALSNDHILKLVRHVLREHGQLTAEIIRKTKGVPSIPTLMRRFGGLSGLYRSLDFKPSPAAHRAFRTDMRVC